MNRTSTGVSMGTGGGELVGFGGTTSLVSFSFLLRSAGSEQIFRDIV